MSTTASHPTFTPTGHSGFDGPHPDLATLADLRRGLFSRPEPVKPVVPHGSRHPKRSLTDEQATELIARWKAGATGKDLATRYGISPSTVSKIVTGRGYRWIRRDA